MRRITRLLFLVTGFFAVAPVFAQTKVPAQAPAQPAPPAAKTKAVAPPAGQPASKSPADPLKVQAPQEPQVQVAPAKLDRVSQMIGSKATETFFEMLRQGQIDAAYDRLTAGTPIAEKPEDITSLKAKTREAVRVFGDITGHELIAAQSVGTRLLSATYVSLGRTFPLRWRFYFYRPEQTWKLIDIRVDDRLEDMFEEKSGPAPVPVRQ